MPNHGVSSPLLGTTLFPQQEKELRIDKGLGGIRVHTAVHTMALSMPGPFATKSGSFYLNLKVPKALRDTARGRSDTLPPGDRPATVTITDTVFLPLRTKDPETAKARFRSAALARKRQSSWRRSTCTMPRRSPPGL